jgi:hypothetical protein
VVVRSVKVASRIAVRLRGRIKPEIAVGYGSKVRRILIAGELVVPTSQTSGRAGLQGNSDSRFRGAIGRRRQQILKVNPTEMARTLKGASLVRGAVCGLIAHHIFDTFSANLADLFFGWLSLLYAVRKSMLCKRPFSVEL